MKIKGKSITQIFSCTRESRKFVNPLPSSCKRVTSNQTGFYFNDMRNEREVSKSLLHSVASELLTLTSKGAGWMRLSC